MANVTIAEAEATLMEVAVPKFISPEVFDPVTSSAPSFLRSFDRCAAANGWRDIHKIHYLGTFLNGAANTWYRSYYQKPANRGKTWINIKADFIQMFSEDESKIVLRRKLGEFRQNANQGIKEFYYQLLELLDEIGDPMLDEQVQIHFEKGLHEKFQDNYYLMADDQMTADQLKNIVFRLAKQKNCSQEQDLILHLGRENIASGEVSRSGSPTSSISQERTDTPASWTWSERRTCYTCGRKGHIAYNCRQGRTGRRCYVCDRVGHVARNCFRRQSVARNYSFPRFMASNSRRQQYFQKSRAFFQPVVNHNRRARSFRYYKSPRATFYYPNYLGRRKNMQECDDTWWNEKSARGNPHGREGNWRNENTRENSHRRENAWRNEKSKGNSYGSEDAWMKDTSRGNSYGNENAWMKEKSRRISYGSEDAWMKKKSRGNSYGSKDAWREEKSRGTSYGSKDAWREKSRGTSYGSKDAWREEKSRGTSYGRKNAWRNGKSTRNSIESEESWREEKSRRNSLGSEESWEDGRNGNRSRSPIKKNSNGKSQVTCCIFCGSFP